MRISHESIFSSSIRSFCIAFFSILGICLSFFLVFLFFAGLFGSSKEGISTDYSYQVLPDENFKRELLAFNTPVVLQLNIQGIIGLEELTGEKIRRQLVESREGIVNGDRVKAILLNIDSPGGLVSDSDAIYHAIMDYKERFKIPVYAFVDGMCASGGMYIACAADKIYASDVSIIGSIGVVAEFFNVSELLNKIGVKTLTLTEGKDKDALNPLRPWKEGEESNFKELEKYFYNQFLDIIVHSRTKLTKESLIENYGAKIFAAPQAEEYGYIDHAHSTWNEALKDLAKAAKINGEDGYQVLTLKEEKWFGGLFKGESKLLSGECMHRIELPGGMDSRLLNKHLYLYTPSH